MLPPRMAREPIPTWYFALVIVRDGPRFLVVHERKHGQRWYLPAGRVEPGETLSQAARRETLEESGIDVELEGVVRIEHTPIADGTARVRVVFVARPIDSRPPKSVPDDESLGAAWVTLEQLDALPLRGDEVRVLFRHVAEGGAVHPMSLLTSEADV